MEKEEMVLGTVGCRARGTRGGLKGKTRDTAAVTWTPNTASCGIRDLGDQARMGGLALSQFAFQDDPASWLKQQDRLIFLV